MTDEKKTPQTPESVKELLGEVHKPWYVRAIPWVLVIALAGGGAWYWQQNRAAGSKVQYVTQPVTKGEIRVR